MFGGAGIYLDDALFAIVDDDRLYFRVDEESLPLYEGMDPWPVTPNGYRELPSAVLADPTELGDRIERAVASRTKRPPKTQRRT